MTSKSHRGVSSTVKLSVSKTELGGSNPSAPARGLKVERLEGRVGAVMGVDTKKMSNSLAAAGDFGDRLKSWPERVKTFYNDVRNEMRKVTAPSFKEVQATTTVVIITVFLFGVYFWAVDNTIGSGINYLFKYLTHR